MRRIKKLVLAPGKNRERPYQEWTKEELYERARQLEIIGRSRMNRLDLIEALQNNLNGSGSASRGAGVVFF